MPLIVTRESRSPLGSVLVHKGFICSVCHQFYPSAFEAHRCEMSHLERCREARNSLEIQEVKKSRSS